MIGSVHTNYFSRTKLKGFTLVELLFSLALLGIWITTFFSLAWNLIETSGISERFQAAQLELTRVGARIDFLIRTADSLEVTGEGQLVIGVMGSSDTRRLFLGGTTIKMEENGNIVQMTGDGVDISNIYFSVYTHPATSARYVTYEITANSSFGGGDLPMVFRSGGETRSLINP